MFAQHTIRGLATRTVAHPRPMTRAISSLITTGELASRLEQVKVLDGSWHMPNANRDPYQDFVAKRIKGARFFGIDDIKDTTVDLPHMLPTPEFFAEQVGKLGITEMDHVVVYDTVGVFSATRVYWTFKAFGHENVSVLNGGLPKWVQEGLPTETGTPAQIEPRTYKVPVLDTRHVRDYAAVLANARLAQKDPSQAVQVLDARPNARFTGEAPEPRAGLSSGHMPGSISVPFNVVIENGQLLNEDELRRVFEAKGVHLDKPIVTSCGSGITASTLYFALERAGAKDIAVYDGSWTEYAGKDDAIIIKD